MAFLFQYCLDSFIEDGHLNLTHDDLRMIPDIVENYDSVELINTKKGYSLMFTKEYGDVVYVVAETIAGKKRDTARDAAEDYLLERDYKKGEQ